MQLEKGLLDESIKLEVERIKLLFKKNKYDKEQMEWFVSAKKNNALKDNDTNSLIVCELLLNEIEKST